MSDKVEPACMWVIEYRLADGKWDPLVGGEYFEERKALEAVVACTKDGLPHDRLRVSKYVREEN